MDRDIDGDVCRELSRVVLFDRVQLGEPSPCTGEYKNYLCDQCGRMLLEM